MSFPITLPDGHVVRLLDGNATVLILPRALPQRKNGHPDLFEVHNARTHRRNLAACLDGRPERQENPAVCVIEVLEITEVAFPKIDHDTVRAAGYANWRELNDDWQRRYRGTPERVHVHQFKIIEARFLHEQVPKGYAHDPAAGAFGEPEAVSEAAVNTMAVENRARFEASRGDEMRRRKVRNVKSRLDAAVRAMDAGEIAKLSRELAILSAEVGAAA